MFSAFTALFNHPCHPPWELSHPPKLKLCPLKHSTPPPSTSGNHGSPSSLYEFDYSVYLIEVESYCSCPFVSDLFHSA